MTKKYSHIYKLIIIGDSGVGKSSLLQRYVDDSFNSNILPTLGKTIIFKIIQINYRY